MKLSGWIFMLTAWILIISLMIFCFSTIIRKGTDIKEEKKKIEEE